ncbi:hypothetical protein [Caulobacter radicis]|uniref:Uncharacterized protein n=1 Tax=Caulobacter radicis TaxID=2172650 RepID=A0A2T9J5W8_9CAUL|nr:hypothetical protein [Caulobacter radicis]PVM76380.1 hypothetical protein DDF65_17810 [Caulobacter radicis]
MNKVITLLMIGFTLALLKAAAIALVLILLVLLLYAFILRPGDTLALLACLGLLGLAGAHPLAVIITIGIVGVASAAASLIPRAHSHAPPERRPQTTPQLTTTSR